MQLLRNQPIVWEGWSFDGERLIDEVGNKYTRNSIKACYFERQKPNVSKLLIHPGCKGCPKAH